MFPRPLTYGDFYRTGVQDCGNGLSIDEFDLGVNLKNGTVGQVLDRTWAQWEKDGMEEQWLAQQDDLEGLDPHKCYENWRAGWKACALQTLEDYVEEQAERENPPPGWWRKPAPTADRPCYRTKTEALKKFLEVNYSIIENYGGADYEVSPSEFDAINHKYGLKGKRAARTIAEAVWAAMPVGKPYCLDRIDLDALNDTSPAREAAIAFRLPDVVYATAMAEGEAQHYAAGQDLPEPAWVTEHEPVRVFPALPPLPEVIPYRVELVEQEPGVATFRFNPKDDMKLKIKMTSTRSGKVGWIRDDGTPTDHESEAGHFEGRLADLMIADYTDNLVRVVGRCANRFELIPVGDKGAPKENPAWVTNILSKHFVQLEEQVPAKWLPKLTKPTASRGKLTATMKEYGCGAYGCVLPTLDPKVVLKLTTDDTEAQFAHELADKLAAPVVVKYHLTRALPEKYKGRPSFLLWRDSADHVGKVEQAIAEDGGTDPTIVEEAISTQHAAAQDAYEALHEGDDATDLIRKWERAAREMGVKVPELKELADGMITNLHKNKVFMGDVHAGNIGRVDGRWVVVDPGHVAVLEA